MTHPPKAAMRRATALLCAAVCSTSASAHNGHGLLGAHGHVSDTLVFVGGVVAVAAALWWRSGKH